MKFQGLLYKIEFWEMLNTERNQASNYTYEEEKDLAKFVEVVADIGFGKTREQIKSMVEKTAREKNLLRKNKISDGWFRRFLERQPQLTFAKR